MITLKNLDKATAKEVFYQVKDHMLKQGKKSANLIGICKYRVVVEDDVVLKCAAGCLIADDEYREEFDAGDDTSWSAMVKNMGVTNKHMDLITDLQRIHDNSKEEEWEEELSFIEYSLDNY